MSEKEKYFHFTLGPVQGFVAQARRTRDFWAGSFILSFLASVAMKSVMKQGGKIEFPKPDDNFLNWLEGKGAGEAPKQGSVPNRFKALQAKVPEGFEPKKVIDDLQFAWKEIAERVFKGDFEPVLEAKERQKSYAIWQRQIESFWEISWCLTDDSSQSNLLDRRKNWRNHMPPAEPGDKCMMIEGLQELSAAERPNQEVRNFWSKIRSHGKKGMRTDLRPSEHLSAIAIVKRRFVRYFDQSLKLNMPGGWTLHGWDLPINIPSVGYLAAAPWLANVISHANDPETFAELEHFLDAVDEFEGGLEGGSIPLQLPEYALRQHNIHNKNLAKINGQFLFEASLETWIADSEKDNEADDAKAYQKCLKHLKGLQGKTSSKPSPFYAILLMDGDSLGSQMSDAKKQSSISQGLQDFTSGIPKIVKQYSGFLVYAGGDDVLALLPTTHAIKCSQAIKHYYDECFNKQNAALLKQGNAKIETSLSGAIEFAHYKSPLTQVLSDAHHLLDDVAKDQTGRDSLAIRIWKPGGLHAQWSAPWKTSDDQELVDELLELRALLAKDLQSDQHFARNFFFKVEQLVKQLGLDQPKHGFEEENIHALIKSAWAHSGKQVKALPKGLEIKLVNFCRQSKRVEKNNRKTVETADEFNHDALKLINFLLNEYRGQLIDGELPLQEQV